MGFNMERKFFPVLFPIEFSGGSYPSHQVDEARDHILLKFHQNR